MTTPAIETPTASWQGVELTGTLCEPTPGGPMLHGTATFELTRMVVNRTEKKIFMPGKFAERALSVDPAGPSFTVMCPATDDPDNLPAGVKIRITVAFDLKWPSLAYEVDVPVASAGPIDLTDLTPTTAVTASKSLAAQPALIVGKAGGVAPLDSSGAIPLQYLPQGAGGLPAGSSGDVLMAGDDGTWKASQISVSLDNVSGMTAAAKAVAKATATDAQKTLFLVAAGAASQATADQLRTDLNGKAAILHDHTVQQVTGLQAALDGKAPVSHKHPLSDLATQVAATVRINGRDVRPDSNGLVDLGTLTGTSVNANSITDASEIGKSLVTASTAQAARDAMGAASKASVDGQFSSVASALQGKVSSVRVNGTTVSPDSNGVVDLGTVAGSTTSAPSATNLTYSALTASI